MCLKSVELSMRWNPKDRAYIGVGYKRMHCLDKTGRLNYSVMLNRYSRKFTEFNPKYMFQYDTIESLDRTQYHPGFHIFINKEDAVNYKFGMTRDVHDVVKVEFKEILAYGYNKLSHYQEKPNSNTNNCVIARYMRIVGLEK